MLLVRRTIHSRISIWACAKTPLTRFDRKGDHLMRIPIHTRCRPDADPDAYPDAVITFA